MADATPELTGDLSVDDIEAAYARALQAVEAVELALPADPASGEQVIGATSAQAPGVSTDTAKPRDIETDEPVLHPRQIVEAVLFVGGEPVTMRRLAQLLGGDRSVEDVERLIESLNDQYAEEARPYRATFGEGGYRLTLLEEFKPVRSRVFGTGPKDVKLSQEALEALAYIAYRQPTRREDLEAAGKQNAATLIRQLLRRRLIELHREDDDVTYTTTPRFLDVFGLRSLDDLPLPEDLEIK